MLTKVVINADALDANQEANNISVIKRPPCFHAIRDGAYVRYRKVENNGVVDISKKGRRVPLASFIATFHSFDESNSFKAKEDFTQDVFFFVGATGLKPVAAVEMPSDFRLTCKETGNFLRFNKGDVLVTNDTGINIGIDKDDFENTYLPDDQLFKFSKPSITVVKSREASTSELGMQ